MAEIKLIKVTHQQSRLEFFEKQLDKATRSMNYHVKRKHHPDICAEYGEIASFYEWAVDKAKEPGWIPVSERLPEDDLPKNSKTKQIKVYVAYKTNGRWVARTQIRAKGYFWGDKDRWSWPKISDPITHWMQLPEPPRED